MAWRYLVLVFLVYPSLAPACLGNWILEIRVLNARTHFSLTTGGSITTRLARANIHASAGRAHGHAMASCARMRSISVDLQGVGTKFEVWLHVPPGVGEVEMLKEVFAAGYVQLDYGPSSALVDAEGEAGHSINGGGWQYLRARNVLARATSSELLAQVGVGFRPPYSEITAQFPISVTSGLGVFSSETGWVTQFVNVCPVDRLDVSERARLRLAAYARSRLFQFFPSLAQCNGEVIARNRGALLCLPACPPQTPGGTGPGQGGPGETGGSGSGTAGGSGGTGGSGNGGGGGP
jgi:hypothetical protein